MLPALLFGIKGYFSFTQASFLKLQLNFNPLPTSLVGKHVVITGANSGLGYVVALELAKRNARVTMVCRNEVTGTEAMKRIVEESGNKEVGLEICDLSLPNSIKALVSRIDPSWLRLLML
jgi:dehydrogenase/reductase SDR family protein 12